jgi:Polyketide cyclase / dehydrase and lipid transport
MADTVPHTGSLRSKAAQVLAAELRNLAGALGERAVRAAVGKADDVTRRLTSFAGGQDEPRNEPLAAAAEKLAEGASPARAAVSAGVAGLKAKIGNLFGRRKGRGGKGKLKVTNIVESADVGVPIRVAYNQWTQFADFPSFMKKVENIDQQSDEKNSWKAQIFLSHRIWEATIVEQVPDSHIVWRSKGEKGHVDGSVTFHELAPNMTRILLVLEYYPQGLFERTGNIWRAQGRRARLEFKHFVRHAMTKTILQPDEVEGWRGEIRDGKVVKDHETALREERRRGGARPDDGAGTDDEDRDAGPDTADDDEDDGSVEPRAAQGRRGPAPGPARPAAPRRSGSPVRRRREESPR